MPQPQRFWRFSYDSEAAVAEMLANSTLLVPTKGVRSEKYNAEKFIAEKIRVGDGVFLGKFDPDLRTGEIVAIGIARSSKPGNTVEWKQFQRKVSPAPPGGTLAWQERCFLFNAGPADRYDLAADFLSKFPNE